MKPLRGERGKKEKRKRGEAVQKRGKEGRGDVNPLVKK